jgi:hypothetical protein
MGHSCFLHYEVTLSAIHLFPDMFGRPITGVFISHNKHVRPAHQKENILGLTLTSVCGV